MMDFVQSDQELALVIGHELAHNSRRHIESRQGNIILGALIGAVATGLTGVNVTNVGAEAGAMAFSQEFEAEADYVGVYHAARAGFDISESADIWRRIATVNPAAINLLGSTHPSTAKRFLAVESAVREIESKRANGLPLIPAEKKKGAE